MAVDPLESKYSPESSYNYGHNNAISWTDSTGMGPDDDSKAHTAQPITGEWEKHDDKGYTGEVAGAFGLPEVSISEHAKEKNKIGYDWTSIKIGTFPVIDNAKNPFGVIKAARPDHNLWYDLNRANLETSIPSNILYGLLNPPSRFLQQLTHSLMGQTSIRNFDGTSAWSSDAQVGAGGNISPLDAGTTALSLVMGAKVPEAADILQARVAYENEVTGLSSVVDEMRMNNSSSEKIARAVHSLRREIGQEWKNVTPEGLREQIYGRNLEKYGDELGPSVEYLRNKQNKSWEDIIKSATTPGRKDVQFSFFKW